MSDKMHATVAGRELGTLSIDNNNKDDDREEEKAGDDAIDNDGRAGVMVGFNYGLRR
jgi:hypothetical protein